MPVAPYCPRLLRLAFAEKFAETGFQGLVFMRLGSIPQLPTVSRKGDYVELKAMMNLVICLSTCPQDILPINSNRPRNAHFQVV